MNRTGLFIALTVAAVVGAVFSLHPELDLRLSAPFYDPVRKEFTLLYRSPMIGILREAATWTIAALAAPAFIALAWKFIVPRRSLIMAGRAIVFLIATIALAPGLLTNIVLKENWARSRPVDVPQFNGTERFTAWWDPRGSCTKNCSFVGGEPSGAFWTLAPAALSPPAWRPLAYGAALLFGVG